MVQTFADERASEAEVKK